MSRMPGGVGQSWLLGHQVSLSPLIVLMGKILACRTLTSFSIGVAESAKRGWLKVSQGTLSVPSDRFIVAAGHYLQVFSKDQKGSSPIVVLDLRSSDVVHELGGRSFELHVGGGCSPGSPDGEDGGVAVGGGGAAAFHLEAADEDMAAEWAATLHQLKTADGAREGQASAAVAAQEAGENAPANSSTSKVCAWAEGHTTVAFSGSSVAGLWRCSAATGSAGKGVSWEAGGGGGGAGGGGTPHQWVCGI